MGLLSLLFVVYFAFEHYLYNLFFCKRKIGMCCNFCSMCRDAINWYGVLFSEFIVIHNGIITNYKDLKKFLVSRAPCTLLWVNMSGSHPITFHDANQTAFHIRFQIHPVFLQHSYSALVDRFCEPSCACIRKELLVHVICLKTMSNIFFGDFKFLCDSISTIDDILVFVCVFVLNTFWSSYLCYAFKAWLDINPTIRDWRMPMHP